MVAVNKCSITGLALRELNRLYWGFNLKNESDVILENYISYINCPTVNPKVCTPDICSNPTIVLVCSLSLPSILGVVNQDNTATFSVNEATIQNGKPPYTYSWDYDDGDLVASGAIDRSSIVLSAYPGKNISLLVTNISVTIIDINGCHHTKSCYLTPSGIDCSNTFIVCPNVTGLVINNKYSNCSGVSALVVSKKQ